MNRARTPLGMSGWFSGDPTDLGLLAFAATAGLGGVLWFGAVASAALTGHGVPSGSLTCALAALTHPGNPGAAWPHPTQLPGPAVYWSITAAVLVVTAAACAAGVRLVARIGDHSGDRSAARMRALPGLAARAELLAAAGPAQVRARAVHARPTQSARAPLAQLGYRLGSAHGRDLWCSVEDSALLVGPPRMGKGLHVVIPWILDAPGAVVSTSTRPDTLAVTLAHRARIGPVAVFDPQRLAGLLPDGLRWSPIRGCESPRIALVRARGLASGAGFSESVTDADFWAGQTETALRCLLHAAALGHRPVIDVYRWSLSPVLAEDAITVLTRDPQAAPGWGEALEAVVHADPRTRDSVWLGVRQALAALADPDVLHALDPGPLDRFDPATFLRDAGTLYLLASAVTSGSCAPLVAAFVEDITETARTLAARSPGARLDPPLLLALDEIANLTPLPSLPSLMAEGGGSGITTLAVLQSLAQARQRWGEHAADAIWDAATVKIILGGLAKMRDLDDVSRLLGEIDEPTRSQSRGGAGDRSTTTSLRTVPVMPPAVLRTLPFGTGVLLLRHTRPAVIDLHPWPTRPDAGQLRTEQRDIEAAAATGAPVHAADVADPSKGAPA